MVEILHTLIFVYIKELLIEGLIKMTKYSQGSRFVAIKLSYIKFLDSTS